MKNKKTNLTEARFVLDLPKNLLEKINGEAEARAQSRASYVRGVLSEALE